MKFLLCIFSSLFVIQALAVYEENPKVDQVAKAICEEAGGEFLGSYALVKKQDGQLHTDGPNQEEIEMNFANLAKLYVESGSRVRPEFTSPDKWNWLDVRFMCYQENSNTISFVLRALSVVDFNYYDLSSIYDGSGVSRSNDQQIVVSNMNLSDPRRDGVPVNGGIGPGLDKAFVKSVVRVALGDVPVESNSGN